MTMMLSKLFDIIKSIKFRNSNTSILIDGYEFRKTCFIHPEQYDVRKDGTMHGYVRLRRGILTCEYPDVGGKFVYSCAFGPRFEGDDANCKGGFDSAIERMKFLTEIKDAIKKEEGK